MLVLILIPRIYVQMTKKIKKLEKETTQWKTKWESNNQALLQMAEEVKFTLLMFEL